MNAAFEKSWISELIEELAITTTLLGYLLQSTSHEERK